MLWLVLIAGWQAFAAEAGYVDPVACRPCHVQIFESYRKTGMGRSFSPAASLPPLTEYLHPASNRAYSVVTRAGARYLRRVEPGLTDVVEKRIDYVIGSGEHSRTFVHRDPRDKLMELPVSWYAEKGGYWSMSPGYDRPDHSDFRREVSDACLFCHNGYPSEANGGLATGIDCQRCHGPGAEHIQGKGKIVNPAKLSSERKLDVCLQCHLETGGRSAPDAIRRIGRGPFAYRPSEPLGQFQLYFAFADPPADERISVNNAGSGLLKSKCFLQSAGKLTCTTCHDPHGTETDYTAACRSCHATQHQASTRDCTTCHMQKRRTEDAVHVVMTDHLIRRTPLRGDLLAPVQERHDRSSGPVILLYPPNAQDSDLYLAMADGGPDALERAIARTGSRNAQTYFALGEAYRKAGKMDQALAAYRQSITRGSDDPRPYNAVATLLLARGDADGAIGLLKAGIERMAKDTSLLNSLAVAYAGRQRFDEALQALSHAVQLNPDEPLTWLNLGVSLEAKGDRKGAAAAYRQAVILQPDFARAKDFLSRVSKN